MSLNKHHHDCQQQAAGLHEASTSHFPEGVPVVTFSPPMEWISFQVNRAVSSQEPFSLHAKLQAPRAAMLQASAQQLST